MKKSTPRPYSRGWRAPWRGTWGPIHHGNTKLAHLARRLEREILNDLVLKSKVNVKKLPPLLLRQVKTVSVLGAIAEREQDQIGTDPKVTPRRVVAAVKAFEKGLAAVRRDAPRPLSFADRLLSKRPYRRRRPAPEVLLDAVRESEKGA